MGRSSGSGMRSAGAREALAWSLARPSGVERSKAFDTKVKAARYANAMETDIARGEYTDPQAGKARFGPCPSGGWRHASLIRAH